MDQPNLAVVPLSYPTLGESLAGFAEVNYDPFDLIVRPQINPERAARELERGRRLFDEDDWDRVGPDGSASWR